MLQDIINPFTFGMILFLGTIAILGPFWVMALRDLGKEHPKTIVKEGEFDYSKLGANNRRTD